jgi:hypothetical protein
MDPSMMAGAMGGGSPMGAPAPPMGGAGQMGPGMIAGGGLPMPPPGKRKRRHGGRPKVRHRRKLRKM